MTQATSHLNPSSSPRTRGSSAFLAARIKSTRHWIPAFAGMTAMLVATFVLLTHDAFASEEEKPVERTYTATPAAPAFQNWDDAKTKSAGCVSCHTASDRKTMHASESVVLGCTDCHGGNAGVFAPAGEHYSADDGHATRMVVRLHERDGTGARAAALSRQLEDERESRTQLYVAAQGIARIRALRQSGRPARRQRSLRRLPPADHPGEREEPDGECRDVLGRGRVQQRHPALQAFDPRRGLYEGRQARRRRHEFDGRQGSPGRQRDAHGILPKSAPMPSWETTPVADIFRVFERGGRNIGTLFPEIGLPDESGKIQRLEEPGRPDLKQSNRGSGTGQPRVDSGAQYPQDAPERSVHLAHGHQRQPGRLSLVGLRSLPRRLRQRPRPVPFGDLREVRQRRHVAAASIRRFRRTNRAIRSGTSSRARSRPASA